MNYPYLYERTATVAELSERFADLEPGAETGHAARIAGRVRSVRGHGKVAFADLEDSSGRIQLFAQGRGSRRGGTRVIPRVQRG